MHIVAIGCHIVSKAHPTRNESHVEIEFRYSVSKAENEICHTMNKVQRQCFVLFRMLLFDTLNDTLSNQKHRLSSYHLKTVFFWSCEKSPPAESTRDTLGLRLIGLLDEFLHFLGQANIPNYCIPGNNMIDYFPQRATQNWIGKLRQVRLDPVAYLFSFFEEKAFYGLFDRIDSLPTLFKPVLDVLDCASSKSRHDACVRALEDISVSVIRDGYSWRDAIIFLQPSGNMRDIKTSVLLSLLFIKYFMKTNSVGKLDPSLFGWIPRLHDIPHDFISHVRLDSRHGNMRMFCDLMMIISYFLIAQKQFCSAAVLLTEMIAESLEGLRGNYLPAGHLCLNIRDSYRLLLICYKEQGLKQEALNCMDELNSFQSRSMLEIVEGGYHYRKDLLVELIMEADITDDERLSTFFGWASQHVALN